MFGKAEVTKDQKGSRSHRKARQAKERPVPELRAAQTTQDKMQGRPPRHLQLINELPDNLSPFVLGCCPEVDSN